MHVTNKLRVVTRTVRTDGRTTEATATAGRSLPTNSAYAAELDHRLTSPLPRCLEAIVSRLLDNCKARVTQRPTSG